MIESPATINPTGPQLRYRRWNAPDVMPCEWQWAQYVNCITLALVECDTGRCLFYSAFEVGEELPRGDEGLDRAPASDRLPTK